MAAVSSCCASFLLGTALLYIGFYIFSSMSTPRHREELALRKFRMTKIVQNSTAIDYLLSAETILFYDNRVSAVSWRQVKAGIIKRGDRFYYVGCIEKLIREVQGDSWPYWNKVKRFFFATLVFNAQKSHLQFDSVQMRFDPFDNEKKSLIEVQKLYNPPEFRNSADCELDKDTVDDGHGYNNPKLIELRGEIYLLFSSRTQIVNRTYCPPGLGRFLYICKLIETEEKARPGVPRNVRCNTPIKLQLYHEREHNISQATRWIPFVYNGGLYFSTKFYPEHVVVDCTRVIFGWNIFCRESFLTSSAAVFGEIVFAATAAGNSTAHRADPQWKNLEVAGGAEANFVRAGSEEKSDYYIGAIHLTARSKHTNTKACSNFLYTTEPDPPFRLTSIGELKLETALSPTFDKLAHIGPIFYKKFYPEDQACAAVSDATLVMPERDKKRPIRKLAITYGVSGSETRIREIQL